MKKHIFGRQLSRDTHERKALFKGLVNSLVMLESITTTEAKARAIRGQVEKLITKGKNGETARRLLQPWLQPEALNKVLNDLSVRFANRPGGYTRMIKLGERFGDNASMAVIEFVEKNPSAKVKISEKVKEEKPVQSKAPAKAEKVEAEVSVKKAKSTKKEKEEKKEQRPPSKSEMMKRSAGKGSPKKESK